MVVLTVALLWLLSLVVFYNQLDGGVVAVVVVVVGSVVVGCIL